MHPTCNLGSYILSAARYRHKKRLVLMTEWRAIQLTVATVKGFLTLDCSPDVSNSNDAGILAHLRLFSYYSR
jgi:hypothetical protein